jgi:hypothetical protein
MSLRQAVQAANVEYYQRKADAAREQRDAWAGGHGHGRADTFSFSLVQWRAMVRRHHRRLRREKKMRKERMRMTTRSMRMTTRSMSKVQKEKRKLLIHRHLSGL